MKVRIQLMRLRLLRCSLKLHYFPGTRLCIADMLSGAHLSPSPTDENTQHEGMEFKMHSLVSTLPSSEVRMNLLKTKLQTKLTYTGNTGLSAIKALWYRPVFKGEM